MWTMPQKLKWSFYSSPIYSPTSMYKLHRKSRHGTWVSSTLNPHQTPTTHINKPNHCVADEIMCKNIFVNWKIPIHVKDEFRKHWCCVFLNSVSLQCATHCAKCFLECYSFTPPHHCSEKQAQSWWSLGAQKGLSSVCWAGCGGLWVRGGQREGELQVKLTLLTKWNPRVTWSRVSPATVSHMEKDICRHACRF